MREVDLSKYNVRTDLVSDLLIKNKVNKVYYYKKIKVSSLKLNKKQAQIINKKPGNYTTIHFNDITDSTNYDNVLKILIRELKKMLKNLNIKPNHSCMIIGLGNEKSTADELGVKTAKKVVITNHINEIIGSLETGYRITTCFIPDVMGNTGVETSDLINGAIKIIKPDFIIVIDALASNSLNNLLKTIQLTSSGINPGSGVGNKRKEISSEVYKIPVIAIGVPTVVESSVIIKDTLKYFNKNYLFDTETINKILPFNYNLIVTPKDIDFIVSKLSNLIGQAINKTIHNISTKNN